MSDRPVFLFGAGATRACGGPLTDELLPTLFAVLREELAHEDDDPGTKLVLELVEFLRECFHLDVGPNFAVPENAFPSLSLVLSMLDLAIDRDHPIGRWEPGDLRRIQEAFRLGIMYAIEMPLLEVPDNSQDPYTRLLEPLYQQGSTAQPTAITLNYDTLLDKAMVRLAKDAGRPLPDYGCDLQLGIEEERRFGKLLKLHGSLNWLYCRRCSHLSLHMSGVKEPDGFWEHVGELFVDLSVLMVASGEAGEPECEQCKKGRPGPLLITPSHEKDYRNAHVTRVWYEAEQALRAADRVVFVGYSLPWDDVDVIYTLRRSLEHLPPERIMVVEHDEHEVGLDAHEVGRRYRSLLGPRIGWTTAGFEGWLDDCKRRGVSPIHGG